MIDDGIDVETNGIGVFDLAQNLPSHLGVRLARWGLHFRIDSEPHGPVSLNGVTQPGRMCSAPSTQKVKRNASYSWRGLNTDRGVPNDGFGEPSKLPGFVELPQPVAVGLNGQKSTAPYTVLK